MNERRLVRVQNLRNTREIHGIDSILPKNNDPATNGWGCLPIEKAAGYVLERNPNYYIPDLSIEEAAVILGSRPKTTIASRAKKEAEQRDLKPIIQSDEQRRKMTNLITSSLISTETDKPFVVVVSPIPWGGGGQGQTPTELARGFAKAGAHVCFVPLFNRAFPNDPPVDKGITVTIPPQINWVVGEVDSGSIRQTIDSIKQVAVERIPTVVFPVASHGSSALAIACADEGWKVVYHCVDDWAYMSKETGEIPSEWAVINAGSTKLVDGEVTLLKDSRILVTATSSILKEKMDKALKFYKREDTCTLIRNGYDPERFFIEDIPAPKDLVIGSITAVYWGTLIGHWMDWDLVTRIAGIDGIEINIIGDIPEDKKPELPSNCHFLGFKPVTSLVAYGNSADVGIIPFRSVEVSKGVDPIKAYEYLACGIPVVCSNLPEIKGIPGVTVTIPRWVEDRVRQSANAGRTGQLPRSEITEYLNKSTWEIRAKELLDLVGR